MNGPPPILPGRAARLSTDQRDGVSARARELDESQTAIALRLADRRQRLDRETARKLTDRTREDLEADAKEGRNALKMLGAAIASLRHRLDENRAAGNRLKTRQTAIEAQKKECTRWERLHDLIGSADGKKYRTFAQGITLELLVARANRQLADMSDRYLLIRDTAQPLELSVVDSYQAGEIRSTRNLSGGESFLVSLALALGLSGMASRSVRVDSLFLDEGFGSLEEEGLESALETLSRLHQDAKLIGIISHVPALQDRIGTQITVTPLSGGRSVLTGPGCARVDRSG